jgi:RNA recognition motif-containing protein
MRTKIYGGNMSFISSEGELRGLFESYGAVDSTRIIVDQYPNRSRGFGFIETENREELLRAVQELDSKEIDGCKPQGPRGPSKDQIRRQRTNDGRIPLVSRGL